MHLTPWLLVTLLALIVSPAHAQSGAPPSATARWLLEQLPRLSGYHDRWHSGRTTVTTRASYTASFEPGDRCVLRLEKFERHSPVTTWETMRWVRRVDLRQLAGIDVGDSHLTGSYLVRLKSGRWTAPIEVSYYHKKRGRAETLAEHYTTRQATVVTATMSDAQRLARALSRLRDGCEAQAP